MEGINREIVVVIRFQICIFDILNTAPMMGLALKT